jgi:hypothetical protein
MKYLLLTCFLSYLSGCASHPIRDQVFESIHQGDSVDKLTALLGTPDSFKPSENVPGGIWYEYKRRRDICKFGVKGTTVIYILCQDDPSYISGGAAMGAVLQGAGKGLQNASQNPQQQPTSCTTTGGPGMYTTNCN